MPVPENVLAGNVGPALSLPALEEEFRCHQDPQRVFAARTASVDACIREAVERHLSPAVNRPFAATAVGGYGRGELFPYSDVDLLLLFENEEDFANLKKPLSDFLRELWDAGLRVSHSVRTVAECCRLNEQNIELHVSLLDLRFVCGSHPVFQTLQQRLPEFYQRHSALLSSRLGEMARARHSKFNDTVYHLEPSIKECPGGIRDIHLLCWLSQLSPKNEALRNSSAELQAAKHFLYTLRGFLHFRMRRDHNLLTFELQDEVAQHLCDRPIDPAEWMRVYYRHARRVFQASLRAIEHSESQDSSLIRQFRDWRSRLSTSEWTVSRDRIFLRNPAGTTQSAESVLQLFTFIARHGIPLSWDAQRRLRADKDKVQALFSAAPPPWDAWKELLSQPNVGRALREMQETELLSAAVPAWKDIDSLVVRDFYHRYTVDEHTLVAIGVIDGLALNLSNTSQRFRQLLLQEEDPGIVRLALLLHDIGKGTRPGDHVEGSLEAAESILNKMGVPASQQAAIRFLIEHHLDLSTVMNGRDLEDPATARYLTSRIGSEDALRSLTLLTFADISAVNPTAMTPWRLEQLWRVYLTGVEQLTRELANDRIGDDNAFADGEPVSPEMSGFLEGLPSRYLRSHKKDEIQRHFQIYQRSRAEGAAVEIERKKDAYLVSAVAPDRPGLFSVLCGALAGSGMNIVKGEVFSNNAGYALELLRFSDPMRTLELNPDETDRLRWAMERAILGAVQVTDLLRGRRSPPRPSRGARILPMVRFNNEASDSATLIDFVGEDRPGLLYDLTATLAQWGCNIEVVLIDTEAHKAVDVFYVTQNGQKLDDTTQQRLHSELVQIAVRG